MTQSSYLISFIRNLMEHSSKDLREKKRRQLEAEFTETGQALNACLSEKFDDVNKILNAYNSVSERIRTNMSDLSGIKKDLIECKSLLHCNREELRVLWLELVELRCCIELLDVLDRLQSAPDAINTLVGIQAWPEATDLTLYASELLHSEIAVVPALQPIKADLAFKCKHIVDQLKQQLYSLLYDRPFAFSLENFKALTGSDLAKRNTQQDIDRADSKRPQAHFGSLPLASWSFCPINFPIPNPNLRKDPLAVAQSIASNVSQQQQQQAGPVASQSKAKPDQLIKSDTDWIRELVAVVHCLARLDRLPQIFAAWSPQSNLSQMQQSIEQTQRVAFSGPLIPGQGLLGELHRYIVVKAVSAVEAKAIAQGITHSLTEVSDPQFLVLLLRLVFDGLLMNARACMLLIRTMKEARAVVLPSFRDVEGLTGDYVWSCVQHEIQLLLSIHLNEGKPSVTGVGSKQTSLSATSNHVVDVRNLGLNALLGRRRAGTVLFSGSPMLGSQKSRPEATVSSSPFLGSLGLMTDSKRGTLELFSFANTSHYQSVSTYMRENRALLDPEPLTSQASAGSVYTAVCIPSMDNILVIYNPVMQFIEAVEKELSCSDAQSARIQPSGAQLQHLRLYLNNFIENTYLPETLKALRIKVQQILSAQDLLNATVSQQMERELGLARPVLSVFLTLNECLAELKRMLVALPEHRTGCLNIATTLVHEFVGAMWQIYRTLSEDASGATVPSSDWAQDDDVSRFWKKFPVWQRMAAHEAQLLASNLLRNSRKEMSSQTADSTSTGSARDRLSTADKEFPQSNHIKSTTMIALGLHSQLDRTAAASMESPLNAHLVIPFAATQSLGPLTSGAEDERVVDYSHLSGLLHEREATRLAAKETSQLIDMIKHELPDDPGQPKNATRQLPTLQNTQSFKVLGRLSESLHWLSYQVLQLDTWLGSLSKLGITSPKTARKQSALPTELATCAQDLTRLSEACLLMIYLEVRCRAFNHFGSLPTGVNYWCQPDDADVDRYVTDFLIYLEQVQDMLMRTINRHKFRFIFDGLGDFIAQLLLRLVPVIPRMNGNGNRKMCRNVYRLQQALASLTESRESDLIRVKQYFELFTLTPETIVERLMEQGMAFDGAVYENLLRLYQRSHSTYPYAKTEECVAKLRSMLQRPAL